MSESDLFPESQDYLFLLAAESVREYENFLSVDCDAICVSAIEKFECEILLNDGYDNIFAECQREKQYSVNTVDNIIESVLRRKTVARTYINTFFFNFSMWPIYIKEIFVRTHIINYSYTTRNKIYLFFWGNGATCDIMFCLSEFFGPKVHIKLLQQQKKLDTHQRKCLGLFRTYTEQKYNSQWNSIFAAD